MTKQITKDNFPTEVLEASKTKPVLVDFFAVWCGSCHLLMPVIDSLADEIGDKVIVVKVDAEAESDLTAEYDVVSLPTLLLFKDGKIVGTLLGIQSKDYIKSILEKYS